ncbi:hypothetical protein O988_09751, partial [Pseudogymnoascus sp. VKM F-3808]
MDCALTAGPGESGPGASWSLWRKRGTTAPALGAMSVYGLGKWTRAEGTRKLPGARWERRGNLRYGMVDETDGRLKCCNLITHRRHPNPSRARLRYDQFQHPYLTARRTRVGWSHLPLLLPPRIPRVAKNDMFAPLATVAAQHARASRTCMPDPVIPALFVCLLRSLLQGVGSGAGGSL